MKLRDEFVVCVLELHWIDGSDLKHFRGENGNVLFVVREQDVLNLELCLEFVNNCLLPKKQSLILVIICALVPFTHDYSDAVCC